MSSLDSPGENMQEQRPPATTAQADAYGVATEEQQTAAPPPILPPQYTDALRDIVMADTTPERPASPAVAPSIPNAPSPIPARVGTPSRNTNGNDTPSRAASQYPELSSTIPNEAPPHGAPTRQYLNSKVTGPLMDGMKLLAKEQPKDPLRALGEYLLQKSKELEGT
ncbi:dpy-30 domain-containing protein [Diplocarpon rosae]|nr:dpy-30 domain-containing protein [Diplocarpon rosae]